MEYLNELYFATTDNNVLRSYEIIRIADIVYGIKIARDDVDAIRAFANNFKGITKELKNPSVKFLVEHGHKIRGMQVLRDRHPNMGLAEAKRIVDEMEEKMKGENKHV